MSNTQNPSSNTRVRQAQEKPMDTRIALRRLIKLVCKDQVERRKEIEALKEQAAKRAQLTKWVMIALAIVAVIVGSHMGSIIYSMNDDMGNMSKKMTSMESSMLIMRDAIVPMSVNMAGMAEDMKSMNTNFGAVRENMDHITGVMDRMQYDTGMMRIGVLNMSRDTRDMGQPFRVMDDFLPNR